MRSISLTFAVVVFFCAGLAAETVFPDSIKKVYQQAPNDSVRGAILYQFAWKQAMNGRLRESRANAVKLYQLGFKQRLPYFSAKAFNLIGITYQGESNYFDALRYYFQSLHLHEQIHNTQGMAFSNQSIGAIYSILGRYADSEPYYLKALSLYQEIRDTNGICYIYQNLGTNAMMQGKYDRAMSNFKSALALRMQSGTQKWSPLVLNEIGDCYLRQHKYNEAEPYFNKALQVSRNNGGILSAVGALIGLANIHYQRRQYTEAKEHLAEVRLKLAFVESDPPAMDAYRLIYKIDSAEKRWDQAFFNFQRYKNFAERINDEEVARKTLERQLRFEFEKKENAMRTEQIQKDTRAEAERKRQLFIRNTLLTGLLLFAFFLTVLFLQNKKVRGQKLRIEREKKRSDELLLNILPAAVAEELKSHGKTEARLYPSVSVMFTDFTNFTIFSANVSPTELVGVIHECYSAFDDIVQRYGVEKIKTIGDAYMAAAGLPVPGDHHALDLVQVAIDIQQFMASHRASRLAKGLPYLEARIGIHTGPVIAGVVGTRKFAYDIWGDTVNTASRLENAGAPSKINISGATHELVKEAFHCSYRGKIEVKGKGQIDMYFVEQKI